jgi:hypothetical protein
MPIDRSIVAALAAYWHEAGVPRTDIDEMRAELESHLEEVAKRGGKTDLVVSDLAGLAEQWAEARLGRRVPSWDDVQSGRVKRRREQRRETVLYGFAVVAMLAAAGVAGKGGQSVDNELWRWVWTIFAVVMGIGEMFTAGCGGGRSPRLARRAPHRPVAGVLRSHGVRLRLPPPVCGPAGP